MEAPVVKSKPPVEAYQLMRLSANAPLFSRPTGVMPFTPLPNAHSNARVSSAAPVVEVKLNRSLFGRPSVSLAPELRSKISNGT